MSKKIFIWFGALFLILFLGSVSAEDICWIEASSADCITNNGKVVMSVSDATNAHGALAGQGTFAPVLCCNFGEGDTTCTADNKILGLSSSTNAHAEAPDLVSPNYAVSVCYDSLKDCKTVGAGTNCNTLNNEVPVVYLSADEAQLYTNAHIEEAGLTSQNYDSKICCEVDEFGLCDLTSAEWQYEEVMNGTDVKMIVNETGTIYCSEVEISFEVFRKKTGTDDACSDITGCENPSNVVFGAGSNSVSGTWSAGPVHDNEYYFIAEVVANPSESVTSSEPDLLIITECPYDPEPVICSDYINEDACNSNICGIDVQDSVPNDVDCSDPSVTCECVWEDNECKGSWGGGGYCGDGVINPGETCDGSSAWGNITNCSNFDAFTGGSLSCDNCHFNTSLCTGGVDGGYCGDNVINPGETCDGSAWEPIEGCSDFDDFTGGTLICGTDCQFDTSQCTGPGAAGPEVGTCVYTQFTDDTCDDDGFLTFSWTAEWIWDEECDATCQAENQNLAAQCVDGQKTVECPAQIPLPFFNIYSFIATLIIIALIYTAIIILKKKKLKLKFK